MKAFHPYSGIDLMREADEFASVHLLAVVFSLITAQASHLSRAFRHGDDDFLRVLFYLIANYVGPREQPLSLDKAFESIFRYLESFDNVSCCKRGHSCPYLFVEVIGHFGTVPLFQENVPKCVHNSIMPDQEIQISLQILFFHVVKIHPRTPLVA